MAPDFLDKARGQALDGLLRELSHNVHLLKELDLPELRGKFPGYEIGWKAILPRSGERIAIVVKQNYPLDPVDVYLLNKIQTYDIPHMERDGRLCLGLATDQFHPYNHVTYSLARIYKADTLLLQAKSNSFPDDEWLSEVASYWQLRAKDFLITFMAAPQCPTRTIACTRSGNHFLVAESRKALETWLNNRDSTNLRTTLGIHPRSYDVGYLIWVDHPISPKQFPKTIDEVMHLGDLNPVHLAHDLKLGRSIPVVIGFNSLNGPVLLGMILGAPRGMNVAPMADAAVLQSIRPLPPRRAVLHRADPQWVHRRGGRSDQVDLGERQVVLIGCGSLGSGVAEALARSGVGQLTLVDPDKLQFGNIARHSLGARDALRPKADALRDSLLRHLPHLRIEANSVSWSDSLDHLRSADLIVATMAVWQENVLLNRWAQTEVTCPVLYGWLEHHAQAAHAVLVRPTTACLECGFSVEGKALVPATEWPGNQLQKEPGCGGHYQPYGAVDLLPAHRLISDYVIDFLTGRAQKPERRVWLGSSERLQSLGGWWSAPWQQLVNPSEVGNRQLVLTWQKRPDCWCN